MNAQDRKIRAAILIEKATGLLENVGWIRGALKRTRHGKIEGFCAIGSLNEATKDMKGDPNYPGDIPRKTAREAIANAIPKGFQPYWWAHERTPEAIKAQRSYSGLTSAIIGFNDRNAGSKKEVIKAFKKASKQLRKDAASE